VRIAIVYSSASTTPVCAKSSTTITSLGRPSFRLVEKAELILTAKRLCQAISRLHVDLTAVLVNVEGRTAASPRQCGQRAEGVLDTGDGIEIEGHDLAQFAS